MKKKTWWRINRGISKGRYHNISFCEWNKIYCRRYCGKDRYERKSSTMVVFQTMIRFMRWEDFCKKKCLSKMLEILSSSGMMKADKGKNWTGTNHYKESSFEIWMRYSFFFVDCWSRHLICQRERLNIRRRRMTASFYKADFPPSLIGAA